MVATLDNLWPLDIKLEVLSPEFILKSQADMIRDVTKGMLEGEVTTVTGDKEFVTHRMDIIPVQLDGSRHRVLSATHRQPLYPVVIEAEVFWPKPKTVSYEYDPSVFFEPFGTTEGKDYERPFPGSVASAG